MSLTVNPTWYTLSIFMVPLPGWLVPPPVAAHRGVAGPLPPFRSVGPLRLKDRNAVDLDERVVVPQTLHLDERRRRVVPAEQLPVDLADRLYPGLGIALVADGEGP